MNPPAKQSVLGVAISVVEYADAVRFIVDRARRRESTIVSAMAVHGVMTGVLERQHRARLNAFDMLTPDGQPVRWAVNLLGGQALKERVYGPELTGRLCAKAAEEQVGVYLYGSRPEVVQGMSARLQELYPGLRIVGVQPHRFREATPAEDAEDVLRINGSGAGIVFVGLGCPRQETWAYDHRGMVRAVMVCVGAAFDFYSGNKPQAPQWMQRHGLEWLYRLLSEPTRLWRRYLLLNPAYVTLIAGECALLGGKRFLRRITRRRQ